MEKTKTHERSTSTKSSSDISRPLIWDCGSSLYDSFELKSFEKQLHSAITSSRTLSMPHLSQRRVPPAPPNKKATSKISCTLQRLFRSVFRTKRNNSTNKNSTSGGRPVQDLPKEGIYYVFFDKPGALSTIPEGPEATEIRPPVRRTASDRFTGATTRIGNNYSA